MTPPPTPVRIVVADDQQVVRDGFAALLQTQPDFTVVALRSTAVLRWELRPGSTLFVVWQQSRGGTSEPVARTLHEIERARQQPRVVLHERDEA